MQRHRTQHPEEKSIPETPERHRNKSAVQQANHQALIHKSCELPEGSRGKLRNAGYPSGDEPDFTETEAEANRQRVSHKVLFPNVAENKWHQQGDELGRLLSQRRIKQGDPFIEA